MSVTVASNRFITSSLKGYAGFYQQLLCGVSNLQELGNRLVYAIETANSFRQLERVEELGLILVNLPIKEYQLIGQYYQGVCAYRKGENKHSIFEKVIEESRTYKAKGLVSLAAVELSRGDLTSSLKIYTEAMRRSDSVSTFLTAARTTGVIKSMEGFHKKALRDLETIAPLTRYVAPVDRYQYLNSLAVELGEVGKVDEAENVCRILLASPYINAYPEWRETSNETERKGYRRSRSAVSVIRPAPENIFKMPIAEASSNSVQEESAKVFSLLDWKEKMGKEPNGEKIEEIENMDEKDLMVKLLYLATHDGVTEKKLRKVVEYALKVFSQPED